MPIPVPKRDDKGNFALGECIRFLRRDKPDMDAKQRMAICLSVGRKGKG